MREKSRGIGPTCSCGGENRILTASLRASAPLFIHSLCSKVFLCAMNKKLENGTRKVDRKPIYNKLDIELGGLKLREREIFGTMTTLKYKD